MKRSAFSNTVNNGDWEYALRDGQFFRRPGSSTENLEYVPFDRDRVPAKIFQQLEVNESAGADA